MYSDIWLKKVRIGKLISAVLLCLLLLSLVSCNHRRTVLVVGGWDDNTIGVLAQTPGLVKVLYDNIPGVDVIVWNKFYSAAADSVLKLHYPQLTIVNGAVDDKGNVHSDDVMRAFKKADMLIHCSCSGLFGANHIKAWEAYTDKPYGIYSATFQEVNDENRPILENASFIFARESSSLAVLEESGIDSSKLELVPDSAFGFELRNDVEAERFMRENGLRDNDFVCFITRLRITPYKNLSKEALCRIQVLNDSCKGPDHAKIREAIVEWVRQTGKKVVLCPELEYEVDIMDELVVDPLPEDVKPYVVKHGYWFPDEAASFYSHACCIVSMDSHSPILSICSGTPAFYIRQQEDTKKGNMFHDIGFDDWILDIDTVSSDKIMTRLLSICNNRQAAQIYLNEGLSEARVRLDSGMEKIRGLL